MINSMNSLIPNHGATERSPLIDQLARKVDGNRDGQVTSAEFSSFLSSLMESLDDELTSQREAGPSSSPTAAEPSVTRLTAEAAPLSRAQGAELLRQAFTPVTRSR